MGTSRIIAVLIVTAALFLRSLFTEPVGPVHALVYLAASVMIAIACSAADRLWKALLSPVTGTAHPVIAMLTRVPFRFMAGGIAFEAALLAAKKFLWIPVRDIPFDALFFTGGTMGLLYCGLLAGARYLKKIKTS
jgi:hypothetical protein